MRSIWTVAQIEIIESLRNRIFYVLIALSLLFIVLGRGCNPGRITNAGLLISPSTRQQIAMSFIFHGVVFWSLSLCSLLASSALPKELEQKTIIMVLCRPVRRASFLAGKLLGVLIIASFNLFLMGSIFISLFYYDAGYFNIKIYAGLLLMVLNMLFIAQMGFMLSLLLPRILVPMIGLVVYSMSIWIEMPYYFNRLKAVWEPSAVMKIIHMIFPKIGALQLLGESMLYSTPPLYDCLISAGNILIYSTLLWMIGLYAFNKREL